MSSKKKIRGDEEVNSKNMTYYDVLGVEVNATLQEIKKQFRKLAITYHPDHKETGDASIFALVANAFETLSTVKKREEYDKVLAIERKVRKADFLSSKKAFEEFIKAQDTDVTSKGTKGLEYAKSKYKLDSDDLDRKRGIDRSQLEEKPMATEEAVKRMRDIEMTREQDDIEYAQPKIFNDEHLPMDKFNRLFELKYKGNANGGKDDGLVKHGGLPSAFNDLGDSSFISYRGDLSDELFEEGENVKGTDRYALASEIGIGKKVHINPEDLEKIGHQKSEYDSHKVFTKEYKNDIEKRLREREMEDKEYENRKVGDFNTDKSMGGYGFLHQVNLTGEEEELENEIEEGARRKLLAAYRKAEISGSRKKHSK
ncbi:MAG: DnaJ domain protein [Hyperionvirus sp.]|uniref:DnaJ domain protein n=1 Tax=Hyperionvirus sp. TaxID=2487770 RepID=A0A3G5ABT8_9VIRU|nr:MAG: DnaJ domain protein [Hyperionvirus sp.]